MGKKCSGGKSWSEIGNSLISLAVYSILFWGRLILIWRSDPEYVAKHGERYAGSLLNGNRVSHAVKLMAGIISTPDLFLTLTFDATRWRDIDAKRFDTARVRFDKFMRFVETQCPNCWFVWSIEVSDIGALHYHLVGSLGGRHGLSKAKSFAGRWLYLTGSKNPGMFDAKAADMSVLGYLFQPQKNQFKLNTRRFPRKRLFGIRGKKNITFGKISKVREITAEERTEIIELIAREMYAERDTAGLWEYAQREVTPFAFCTEEVVGMVKKLVKELVQKRKK